VRADRLVAILMMLQTRGQVTAAQVAEELEVSERTARRDLDALGQAGLPIYSTQGRGGGWRLLGSGRTDLSGLTAPEARALFRLAGPSSGATPELKAALRKLVRALPEPFRPGAEAAAASVVVDPAGWGGRAWRRGSPPLLDDLQAAVVDGRQVRMAYVDRQGQPSERTVDPLGLAAKGSVWYLIGQTYAGLRTFRVDRVSAVKQTGSTVVKPEGFDLAAAWRSITEAVDELRSPVLARAVIRPEVLEPVRWTLGPRVSIGPARPDGRIDVEVRGYNVRSLAGELSGFGAAVEVLDPPELRLRLADLGRELDALYSPA
jgi:predicted DNA-binding transcriptional regulator YafY